MRFKEQLLRMTVSRQEVTRLVAQLSPDQLTEEISKLFGEACVAHDLITALPIPTQGYRQEAERVMDTFYLLIRYAKEQLEMTDTHVAAAFEKVVATLPDEATAKAYWQSALNPVVSNALAGGLKHGELVAISATTSKPMSQESVEFLEACALRAQVDQFITVPAAATGEVSVEEYQARITNRAVDLPDGSVVLFKRGGDDLPQYTPERILELLQSVEMAPADFDTQSAQTLGTPTLLDALPNVIPTGAEKAKRVSIKCAKGDGFNFTQIQALIQIVRGLEEDVGKRNAELVRMGSVPLTQANIDSIARVDYKLPEKLSAELTELKAGRRKVHWDKVDAFEKAGFMVSFNSTEGKGNLYFKGGYIVF